MTEPPDPSGESDRPAAPTPGPGERLCRVRESAGLDLARVAAELHLAPATLEALERDDFGSLPPTYVQGYLRSYAKRLGLAADPILEAYRRCCVPEPLPAEPVPTPSPAEVGVGRARRGLYALLAVLAVAVFLTWWFRGATPPRAPVRRPAATPPAAAPKPAPAPRSAPASTPAPAPTLAPTPGPTPALSSAPVPTPESAPPPASPAPQTTHAAAPSPPPVRSSVPAAGGPQLVLRCHADSWVEVRDASGRRLVYDLLHAGDVRRVTGTPPFRVLIGNAGAVQMEWDGRAVPLPQRPPGTVERLTVGGKPSP